MLRENSIVTAKLQAFRRALSHVDALPQLSLLALLIGACTGFTIVGFRLLISMPHLFFPMSSSEDFESLTGANSVLLILISTVIIAITLHWLHKYHRQMSVAHVIDRLHNHQGRLPIPNLFAQFGLATIAIAGGHSVGREGPAIHLGAGVASQIGRWLRLPNNSMQTLIACGVAAAIAASFDTPLAGVIFAMEVIVMEYSIVGFVPVILSSVIGAAVSKALLGNAELFAVGDSHISSLYELIAIAFAGLIIALLAGSYIKIGLFVSKLTKPPIFLRVLAGGMLTALVAYFVPEIMGLGYDTISAALLGNLSVSALMLIAAAKLLVTPTAIALGIPGGLIGPSLFIGACVGALIGLLVDGFFPSLSVNASLYILLGMAGMMAAVINAPLAALIAVLELSHNPDIIFPAMLMIVVACLSTRIVFRVRSIFIEQLAISGHNIETGPAARALRRSGVVSIMNRNVIQSDESIRLDHARYIVSAQPQWVVFSFEEQLIALWAADLAHFMDSAPESVIAGEEPIRLHEIPGKRHRMQGILESESLYDALKTIRKSHCDVLYVTSNLLSHRGIHGIVTLEAIQNHYQPKAM